MKTDKKKLRFKEQQQTLVSTIDRGIFKAIDPYQENQEFLFKSKKNHLRHHSQPFQPNDDERNLSQSNHVTESIQQILRKAHKASHMRLMSEMSESTRLYKKPKQNDFMYNKWYMKPQVRLKKIYQSPFQSRQLLAQTDGFKMKKNQPNFRQSQITQSKTQQPFTQKESPNIKFAKQFNKSHDKKTVNLLKEFKRKQTFKKDRTPQLVDLILEMNKKKKENNKSSMTSTTKKTITFQESVECSKSPSKFFIDDNDLSRTTTNKKRTLLESSRRHLTLNESKYLEIRQQVHQTSRIDQTYDGFKISRVNIQ